MKLLFLGDSITDAYHCFDPENLGEGYVRMIHDSLHSHLLSPFSGSLEDSALQIVNKGIDGFTVPRVYDMWQSISDKTCWDAVSILVGVNDVGVWMDCGHSDDWIQKAVLKFSQTYEDLITDILDHGIRQIILMEPFIFSWPKKYSVWQPWLEELSSHIQKLAKRYHLVFVPLQKTLSEAAAAEGYAAITLDGIHLTERGNQLLANAWLKHLSIKYQK